MELTNWRELSDRGPGLVPCLDFPGGRAAAGFADLAAGVPADACFLHVRQAGAGPLAASADSLASQFASALESSTRHLTAAELADARDLSEQLPATYPDNLPRIAAALTDLARIDLCWVEMPVVQQLLDVVVASVSGIDAAQVFCTRDVASPRTAESLVAYVSASGNRITPPDPARAMLAAAGRPPYCDGARLVRHLRPDPRRSGSFGVVASSARPGRGSGRA